MEQKYDSWDMVETIWRTNPGHGPIKKYLEDKTMWKCLEFCYLFPPNHEFHGADMIRLWVAEGFFHDSEEYKAGGYFQEFEHMQIFLLSHLDYSTSRRRYTLNKSIVSILEKLHNDIYVRIEDDISYISENTLHTSLQGSSIDPNDLEGLYEAEKLCTLLILHEHGSCIDQVPRHLFLKLPLLCVLDLSHTNITELPSSIGNLKALKYLNLSGTLITTLPNSLCSLDKLQTLKLRGCVELLGLPKGLRKLINLRHLDVDVDSLLDSMPPGLGNLRKLQTLPAFVVGKEDGCHITELVSLVNLRGTLRIMRLENVSNSEEAKQLYWYYKPSLSKLELQWTELKDGLEILENIQPPRKIKELQIRGYGGVKFPGWIGTTEFSQLATITLCDCPKCEFLPPLGNLPSLKRLHISDMHAVKKIDSKFCVRFFIMGAFQRLENLTLNGMPQLEKWSGIKEGDFPHLQKLSIIGCPKLATLPQLALLKSLRQFEINICASLKSFPREKLPTSLQYLVIIECPLLKERCRKDEGPDWVKIAHVPNIKIDYQQISDEQVQITHKLAMENKGGSNPVLKQIKVLAKSGRGIVQLVRNEWTGQLLALKGIQVKFQEDLVKHITTQLKVNQSAQCPHIAVCYRSAYDNGVIFIIMEYMDGGSLADLLKKVNSIPEPYLAAISKQVLKGLLYLHHDRHIIHRNLKPSNLLINHRGEVKITDTGVSAILATSSAEYMSPERISESNYSYKTDIWSLGLVLLECATGRFPYSAPKQEEGWSNHFYELMEAVVDQHPPCPSSEEFSPEFCSFISSCLQKDPMHRQTAHELVEHPFISKYNDLNVDLAAYFTHAGSPVLLSSRSI